MIIFETEKAKTDLMNYIKKEGFLRIEGLSFSTVSGEIDADIEISLEGGEFKVVAFDQETEEPIDTDLNMEWTEIDSEVYEIF